jgi:hypothetical protein
MHRPAGRLDLVSFVASYFHTITMPRLAGDASPEFQYSTHAGEDHRQSRCLNLGTYLFHPRGRVGAGLPMVSNFSLLSCDPRVGGSRGSKGSKREPLPVRPAGGWEQVLAISEATILTRRTSRPPPACPATPFPVLERAQKRKSHVSTAPGLSCDKLVPWGYLFFWVSHVSTAPGLSCDRGPRFRLGHKALRTGFREPVNSWGMKAGSRVRFAQQVGSRAITALVMLLQT